MSKSFPNTGAITGTNADRLALSGVFEGMQFFETDTNKTLVYDGSSWVETNDLDNPGGLSSFAYTPPMVRLTQSTGQVLASGSNQTLTWDTETFDTDSMHSTVTNTSRITFNTAGIYLVGLFLSLTANTNVNAWILHDSRRIVSSNPNSAGGGYNMSVLFKFAVNDYIDAQTYSTSAHTAAAETTFWATWVGNN